MLDGAFLTHAIMWLIGAMAICSGVGVAAALISMAKSGYRKD